MRFVPFQSRIQPAPRGGGFRDDEQWIWGGSPLRGGDGRYHLFVSMWPKNVPFDPNWLTNSRVVRAVADTLEGPYAYAGEVLPPRGLEFWDGCMTHNPTIHRHGDSLLLYYTGTTYDAPIPENGPPTEETRFQAWKNQRIGLAIATDPEGPWRRFDMPILNPRAGHWDDMITTNPAALVNEDGSVLLLYKSRTGKHGPIQYGVAAADCPEGPYRRLHNEPFQPLPGKSISYEDAYLWREGGFYHMIFNDMTGQVTGEDHAGAHAVSEDGVVWRMATPPKAYSRRILWDDGRETMQGAFERAQIFMADGKATHLFAATADGPGGFSNAKHTWNMVVPLRVPC